MKKEILRVEHLQAAPFLYPTLEIDHLNIFKGEAVALIGLSDSGINLFVDVLCGKIPVAEGRILIDEKPVQLLDEAAARFAGIYRLSQDQTLIDEMSIAENIFVLRRNSLKNLRLPRALLLNQAAALLQSLGIYLSPSLPAGRLTPSQKHLVELAKMVGGGAKLIIFDEVLVSYTLEELNRLRQIINHLKAQGISFLFCGQNLDDILQFTEKVVFFKEGRITRKVARVAFENSMITDFAVGYALESPEHLPENTLGEVVFAVENIILPGHDHLRQFSIRAGEVVAFVEMDERRKEHLYLALTGQENMPGLAFYLDGRRLETVSQESFFNQRIVCVENLHRDTSLLSNLSAEENLLFPSLKKIAGPAGYISGDISETLKKDFFGPGAFAVPNVLELDNHQKISLVLERWFIFRPKVLILKNPFSQVDEIGRDLIARAVEKFSRAGTAVIILASRENRLEGICHRIIVSKTPVSRSDASPEPESASKTAWIFPGGRLASLLEQGKKYTAAFLILSGYLLVLRPELTAGNLVILSRQCAILGLAVLAAYITVLCDGYNFSVGPLIAATTVLAVFLAGTLHLPLWLAVIATLALLMFLGAFYAFVTVQSGIPIMLFSLGMMLILPGITASLQSLIPAVRFEELAGLANGEFLSLPIPVLIFSLAVLLVYLVINHTYLGRAVLAVGSNESEARRTGLPVNTVKLAAYILSFFFIGICGLILLGRTGTASADYARSYFYDLLVALCLGRVSLWGGKGTLTGVFLGTLSVVLIESFVIQTGAGLFYEVMIKGLIILLMLFWDYTFYQKKKLADARRLI